ncbi:MAG: nitrile hydratase subunit beta [Acidimicrobiales bacterium]
MDGIHDMGGMDGFGAVEVEREEPVFHAAWEGRVMAIRWAMGYVRALPIDRFRSALERLAPQVYLTSSYYRRWLLGMETNVVDQGIAGADELEAGRSLRAGGGPERILSPENVEAAFGRGRFERTAPRRPRYGVGDRVRARNMHPRSHTRLPRYVRGHTGTVVRVHGCHVFPDSAVSGDEDPQWLYAVRFQGAELWGDESDPTLTVSVDAFEPYLEPARSRPRRERKT